MVMRSMMWDGLMQSSYSARRHVAKSYKKLTMIRCLPGPSQIYATQCKRCTNTTNEGERGADGDAVDDVSDDGASDWRL